MPMKVPYLCVCECGGLIKDIDTIGDFLPDNNHELGFVMQGVCEKCLALHQWKEYFSFDRVENLEKVLDIYSDM